MLDVPGDQNPNPNATGTGTQRRSSKKKRCRSKSKDVPKKSRDERESLARSEKMRLECIALADKANVNVKEPGPGSLPGGKKKVKGDQGEKQSKKQSQSQDKNRESGSKPGQGEDKPKPLPGPEQAEAGEDECSDPECRSRSRRQQKKPRARANRRISRLVFVMPKTDDPQLKLQHASEKKMGKLIRYLRKYWRISIDKKFYPIKIDYRQLDRMTHQRPDSWWLLKRARQKQVEHTGFFSNVREPYHDLGAPEMDASMLVFKNLHSDLHVDATKWIQDRQLKDEMIQKCNAPLERLPRTRVRRPLYNKGRVKHGVGGGDSINKYVKTGYGFQKSIRGNVTYVQTLETWMDNMETEAQDLASAFGYVPKPNPNPNGTNFEAGAGVTSDRAQNHRPHASGKPEKRKMSEDDTPQNIHAFDDIKHNSSAVDDRSYQRSMLNFETMMLAIYDIIISLLNIKMSHIQSDYALPLRVILALRSHTPITESARKKQTMKALKCCKDRLKDVKGTHIFATALAEIAKQSAENAKARAEAQAKLDALTKKPRRSSRKTTSDKPREGAEKENKEKQKQNDIDLEADFEDDENENEFEFEDEGYEEEMTDDQNDPPKPKSSPKSESRKSNDKLKQQAETKNENLMEEQEQAQEFEEEGQEEFEYQYEYEEENDENEEEEEEEECDTFETDAYKQLGMKITSTEQKRRQECLTMAREEKSAQLEAALETRRRKISANTKQVVKTIKTQQHRRESGKEGKGQSQGQTQGQGQGQRNNSFGDTVAMNMSKTEEMYNKLFKHGHLAKPPIWKLFSADNTLSMVQSIPSLSVVSVESQTLKDAAGSIVPVPTEDLPFSSSNDRLSIPSTAKIPHLDEIHTPVLAGLEAPPQIDSEEQSRLNVLAQNPEGARTTPPPSPILHLYKVAGIETTEKMMFDNLLQLKKKFRNTEKTLRFYYTNETEKSDWETMNRYRHKIQAIESCPIYDLSIATMRSSMKYAIEDEDVEPAEIPTFIQTKTAKMTASKTNTNATRGDKRPALWYRKLKEKADEIGASRHLGCAAVLMKLYEYCDVDMKSRPKMLQRFCLLVVSLPTTELGTRPWQLAVMFILDNLLGMPSDLFYTWLAYRRLPALI